MFSSCREAGLTLSKISLRAQLHSAGRICARGSCSTVSSGHESDRRRKCSLESTSRQFSTSCPQRRLLPPLLPSSASLLIVLLKSNINGVDSSKAGPLLRIDSASSCRSLPRRTRLRMLTCPVHFRFAYIKHSHSFFENEFAMDADIDPGRW